jgi:hypothetical protein
LSITFCRDKGIRVKNFDLIFGPIVVNLEEKLFTKKKLSASTVADQKDEPVVDNKPAAKSEGSKLLSLNKKIDLFPEKVVLISCSTTDVCHFLLYMGIVFLLIWFCDFWLLSAFDIIKQESASATLFFKCMRP